MARNPRTLLASALCAVLIALYFAGPWTQLLVHFIVSQVCHGVSAGKILFTLIFVGIFAVLSTLTRGGRPPPAHKWSIAIGTTIGLGLILSLASHLAYRLEFDLPATRSVFQWKDGYNSVNNIGHIHTSKGAIAISLRAVGLESLASKFDTGLPYADLIPRWMLLGIGFCFVAATLGCLLLGPRYVAAYPVDQRPWVALTLGLASAALCKSIVDGGPLAYDTVAALMFFGLLIITRNLLDIPAILERTWIYFVAAFLVWCIALTLMFNTSMSQFGWFLYRIAIYSMLLLPAVIKDGWRVRLLPARSLAVLTCAVGLFAIEAASRDLFPLFDRPPASVVHYDCDAAAGGAREVSAKIVPVTAQTLVDMYAELGESPNRVMWTSVSGADTGNPTRKDPTDAEKEPSRFAADVIVLKAAGPIHLSAGRFVSATQLSSSQVNGHTQLRLVFELKPDLTPRVAIGRVAASDQVQINERYVAYRLVDNYLRSCGISEYTLIPLPERLMRPKKPSARAVAGAQ